MTSEAAKWRHAWHRAFQSQRSRIDVRSAILGALVTGIPLAVGVASGHKTLGLFASFGGLNVALGLSAGSRSERARWSLVTLVGSSVGVALATLVSGSGLLLVLATLVWVGVWALVRAAGPAGIVVGFVNSAVFIIAGGQTATPADALPRTVAYAISGVVSMLLFLAFTSPGPAPDTQAPTEDGAADATDGSEQLPASIPSFRSLRVALAADTRAVRYALEAGVVIATATAFELIIGMAQGYWVPLAGVAVIQPDARATRVRAVQRAAGTLIGVVAAAVVIGVTRNQSVLVAMVFVVTGALFALKDRGYHWLVILLTPTVLIMLAAVSSSRWSLLTTRVIDNAVGIVLAVVLLAGWDYVARWRDRP